MSNEPVEILSFSYSHKGNVREDNQDAVQLCNHSKEPGNETGHLYAIADGMGGFANGSIASTTALSTFFETFYEARKATSLAKLKVSMQNANLSVYQEARRLSAGKMGTTLTAINIVGRTAHFAHIGDTRAYLIRNNKATCLTNDHTRVAELVRMKLLTPEKVRTHSQRSVLEKCLGLELFIQPDLFSVPVREDDMIIMCSDGIWAMIEDHEFAQLTVGRTDSESICEEIANIALERFSDDNVSIIILYLNRLSDYDPQANKVKKSFIPDLLKKFLNK